jgi:hypothetical protein
MKFHPIAFLTPRARHISRLLTLVMRRGSASTTSSWQRHDPNTVQQLIIDAFLTMRLERGK